MSQLQGAKVIVADEENDVVFAWHGGTGIHVYDRSGREVDYFMTGGHKSSATASEVRAAIRRHQKYMRE
jgi:hypothetical protein